MRVPETATGLFESGDPVTGKAGSRLSSAYMNSDLREKLNILRAAGIAQDNDDDGQLLASIRKLINTATAVVQPPIHGGTGLNWVPPGNYLVGNGTATMTSKTPGQVLRDIGAIPVGGAMRRVRLTVESNANMLIADHVYYTWSNSVVMGANFPSIRGTGYMLGYFMASDHFAQELTVLVTGRKPYRFNRVGNPSTGVWQPWKVASSFSNDYSMPNWDAGDIYVDGKGWHLWDGSKYVVSAALLKCSAKALPATDVGPIFVTEFGEIWSWVSTANYTGYRSPNCGQIAYFATESAPPGWFKANGYLVLKTAYPGLFGAVGTKYGPGDALYYKLPDLRGEFIRGWDDGRGVDRLRAFGTAQPDAFQGHWHQYYINAMAYGTSNHEGSGDAATMGAAGSPIAGRVREAISDGVNGVPRTASETRPRNVALLACIKI